MGALRDKLISADALPRREIETAEWAPFGVPSVHVRGLSAKEREDWEDKVTIPGPNGTTRPNPKFKNVRARFVAMVVVDADGKPELSEDDVVWLQNQPVVVLDRIARVGLQLSGMLPDEEEDGNPFGGDLAASSSPASDSPSASPTSTTSPSA